MEKLHSVRIDGFTLWKLSFVCLCSLVPCRLQSAFCELLFYHDGLSLLCCARYLINGLHDEANLARPRVGTKTGFDTPRDSAEAWSQYKQIDDSPLVDMVAGQLSSTIECTGMCSARDSFAMRSLCSFWTPLMIMLPLSNVIQLAVTGRFATILSWISVCHCLANVTATSSGTWCANYIVILSVPIISTQLTNDNVLVCCWRFVCTDAWKNFKRWKSSITMKRLIAKTANALPSQASA